MQAPGSTGKKAILPVAALCCLGIIALLVAATIVLALIPVYLPQKSVTVSTNVNDVFYLQYLANVPLASSVTGTLTNPDDILSALGISSSAAALTGKAQAGFVRRKRILNFRRQRRQEEGPTTAILIQCTLKVSSSCNKKCRDDQKVKISTKANSNTSLTDIPLSIRSQGVAKTYKLALKYNGLIFTRPPPGFAGESTSFVFVAIKTGLFNSYDTWADGTVPYGEFSAAITAGITVRLPRTKLPVKMKKCHVYGSLALGFGKGNFGFEYKSAIIVRSGGTIQDLTNNKNLLIPLSSVVMVLKGGSCGGAGTMMQARGPDGAGGKNHILTSPFGPQTFCVLPDGQALRFDKIMFIAIQSGGFTSESTFLGDFAPSADVCSEGCSVTVKAGVTLSTADLNGIMNMKIDSLLVEEGASLELGSPDSTDGFKFMFAITLEIYGTLTFVARGGGIFLPPSSNFLLRGSGKFKSLYVSAFIQIWDPLTGKLIGSPWILGFGLSGPYFVIISATGEITFSTGDDSGNGHGHTSTMRMYTTDFLDY